MKQLFLFLFLVTLPHLLMAKEVTIATMVNDGEAKHEVIKINLDLDANQEISGFSFHKWDSNRQEIIYSVYFSVNDIKTVVNLEPVGDTHLFKLSSPEIDPKLGGKIKINFLSNGISKSRTETSLDLKRVEGRWTFVSKQRGLNALFVKTKKIFSKTIGIDYLMFKGKEDTSWSIVKP